MYRDCASYTAYTHVYTVIYDYICIYCVYDVCPYGFGPLVGPCRQVVSWQHVKPCQAVHAVIPETHETSSKTALNQLEQVYNIQEAYRCTVTQSHKYIFQFPGTPNDQKQMRRGSLLIFPSGEMNNLNMHFYLFDVVWRWRCLFLHFDSHHGDWWQHLKSICPRPICHTRIECRMATFISALTAESALSKGHL